MMLKNHFQSSTKKNLKREEQKTTENSKTIKKIVPIDKRGPMEKWYKDIKAKFGDLTDYYQIQKEISRGAYGVVYKARMLDKERTATTFKTAIKAMFPHIH
jgi:hypothetical protein